MSQLAKEKRKFGGPQPGSGRPKAVIPVEELTKLAAMQCTEQEAADWLGIERRTLLRHFAADPSLKELWERGQSKGKISLRRAMWQQAQKGDKTMLIWLSKNHLGMRDIQQHELSGRDGGAIVVREWADLLEGMGVAATTPATVGDNGGRSVH